ncbi:Rne/Rng family ribonuclease [Tepidibacillus sp. LV47]|uniref:Rne/Rng family ribonuclease n=1 Tax=Tepidibacillus sp. LV47 TaxID=3398228 RepID=UPI003AAC9C9B
MKKIVVHVAKNETRAALIENEKLVEFYVERSTEDQLVGNIYVGKVVNVLPGMQAAFVDIGIEKNAFLYIDDAILPGEYEACEKEWETNIREILHEGQKILVQVKKEAFGNKGPRVTTHVSLPGRYLVYLPMANYVGISRKITSETERLRLKEIGESIREEKEGLIIRTVAEGIDTEYLKDDLKFLRTQWLKIQDKSKSVTAPSLIYQDLGLVQRLVRDFLSDEVKQFVIDDGPTFRRLKEAIQSFAPELTERLYLYTEKEYIFDAFHIQGEIEKALKRKVWLKSGGYIVIDQTEALTVIDVNTGKFTGHSHLEDTVLKTNIEAAIEIARQLRLRDIGGIIIIDFIDMKEESHREKILQVLQEETKKDKTKTNILGLTQLGLVEMTRKKIRQNLGSILLKTCPFCDGTGRVVSEEVIKEKIERELKRYKEDSAFHTFLLEAHPNVISVFVGSHQENLDRLEQELGKKITVKGNPNFHYHQYQIHFLT